MNVIFVTQGKFAEFYLDLLPLIVQKLDLGKIGFYLSSRSTLSIIFKKDKKSRFGHQVIERMGN